MITKIKCAFHQPFWLTTSIYPIYNPAHPNILDTKKETITFAQFFITLTVYENYPEPHLTQYNINILGELMDTAEIHICTHTCYYIKEIKKVVKNQSYSKSSFLVVSEFNRYSWWCSHLFLTISGASFLLFYHWCCQ